MRGLRTGGRLAFGGRVTDALLLAGLVAATVGAANSTPAEREGVRCARPAAFLGLGVLGLPSVIILRGCATTQM